MLRQLLAKTRSLATSFTLPNVDHRTFCTAQRQIEQLASDCMVLLSPIKQEVLSKEQPTEEQLEMHNLRKLLVQQTDQCVLVVEKYSEFAADFKLAAQRLCNMQTVLFKPLKVISFDPASPIEDYLSVQTEYLRNWLCYMNLRLRNAAEDCKSMQCMLNSYVNLLACVDNPNLTFLDEQVQRLCTLALSRFNRVQTACDSCNLISLHFTEFEIALREMMKQSEQSYFVVSAILCRPALRARALG